MNPINSQSVTETFPVHLNDFLKETYGIALENDFPNISLISLQKSALELNRKKPAISSKEALLRSAFHLSTPYMTKYLIQNPAVFIEKLDLPIVWKETNPALLKILLLGYQHLKNSFFATFNSDDLRTVLSSPEGDKIIKKIYPAYLVKKRFSTDLVKIEKEAYDAVVNHISLLSNELKKADLSPLQTDVLTMILKQNDEARSSIQSVLLT